MRAYIGVTALEIQGFLHSSEFDVSDAYAATSTFIAANNDLDEEEIEYTLSMVAAQDALELTEETSGSAYVLALEIPDLIIDAHHDMSVSLAAPLKWEFVQCCFEVSPDGEELTWFATQEIETNLAQWLA